RHAGVRADPRAGLRQEDRRGPTVVDQVRSPCGGPLPRRGGRGRARRGGRAFLMAAALELRDLHAAYGRIEVLHGVDLIVPEASVFALLGPNGAGKTTTLKTVDGRLRPGRG